MPGVDPSITNWALSQVAAALGPALSQLAAGSIQPMQSTVAQQQQQQAQAQQQQQQQQFHAQRQQQAQQLIAEQKTNLQNRIQEQQAVVNQKLFQLLNQEKVEAKVEPIEIQAQPCPSRLQSVQDDHKMFAAQLKQAYDRHLSSLEPECTSNKPNSNTLSNQGTDMSSKTYISPAPGNHNKSADKLFRTEEDKEGGTALLGFLSSLRKSYDSVVHEKQFSSGGDSLYSSNRAATVTDSNSSQQRDSSVEDSDWNSDKKSDHSSSDDSEKEESSGKKGRTVNTYQSHGPPRKRMKVMRVADAVKKDSSTS
jgi:hypothetical protein